MTDCGAARLWVVITQEAAVDGEIQNGSSLMGMKSQERESYNTELTDKKSDVYPEMMVLINLSGILPGNRGRVAIQTFNLLSIQDSQM